jgi:hypothetical protein
MDFIKRILSILKYFSGAIGAIIKGFEVTANAWPDTNPFADHVSNKLEKNIDMDSTKGTP